MPTCQHCQTENTDEAAFCMKCGQALSPEGDAAQRNQPLVQFRLIDPTSDLEIPLTSDAQNVIGRADDSWHPDIDLPKVSGIPTRGISRRHAVVEVRGGKVTVMDLRSTNGTLVNGKQIPPSVPQPLRDEDVLEIGGITLVFRCS